MHMRAKTSHEIKGTACRAQRQDCIRHRYGEGYKKKIGAALKVLKSTVASIILKWEKFGTTRTFPRAGRSAKLSNWWKRALSRLVTKILMVTLVELHDHICRWEKPTEGQTSLQHSTDLGFMAVCLNTILSSVKTHLEFAKLHLQDPQRNKILWSDEPQF